MFPSNFEYFAPTTIDEAVALLAEHGDDAKVLAGGQSLIPLMKLRFAAPAVVIDINRVTGLDHLDESKRGKGYLRVGALVRNATLERSELVAARYPTMATAAPLISDPIVRNQGTLVGSLCHADPQGDFASVMLALDGEVVARSARGDRRIPIQRFLDGPFTSTLAPDELAIEARVPSPQGRFSGTYLKLERKVGDFATAAAAVQVTLDASGRIERAGIGLTSAGPTPVKAREAEAFLQGRAPEPSVVAEAARLAAAATSPTADRRGSVEYKREMARVLTARALRKAVERAGGQ